MRSPLILAGFGSTLIVIAISSTTLTHTTARMRHNQLSERELQSITGLDKASHVIGIKSCEQHNADTFFPPTALLVAGDSGCTAANSVNGNTNCVLCDPHDAAANQMLTGPGVPPGQNGTRPGTTYSCGVMVIGICKMINGSPGCGNQTALDNDCLDVSERWIQ